ncbi:hypothetical protein BGZ83_010682 [Gryganskiella cystojenkinii]|nr:hypothetical protein BGZ83_010682 [Gryganskiella cystojenkinii]
MDKKDDEKPLYDNLSKATFSLAVAQSLVRASCYASCFGFLTLGKYLYRNPLFWEFVICYSVANFIILGIRILRILRRILAVAPEHDQEWAHAWDHSITVTTMAGIIGLSWINAGPLIEAELFGRV